MSKLSDEIYRQMQEAYFRKQTIASVAEATGVTEVTARKYINTGSPKLGRPSLKDQYAAQVTSRTQAQAKAIVYDLSEASSATLKLTKAAKGILARQLTAMMNDPAAFRDPASALDKIHRIEMTLLGGVTDVLALQGGSAKTDPLAGLEEAELLAFVEVGLSILKRSVAIGLRMPPEHTVAAAMEVIDAESNAAATA